MSWIAAWVLAAPPSLACPPPLSLQFATLTRSIRYIARGCCTSPARRCWPRNRASPSPTLQRLQPIDRRRRGHLEPRKPLERRRPNCASSPATRSLPAASYRALSKTTYAFARNCQPPRLTLRLATISPQARPGTLPSQAPCLPRRRASSKFREPLRPPKTPNRKSPLRMLRRKLSSSPQTRASPPFLSTRMLLPRRSELKPEM